MQDVNPTLWLVFVGALVIPFCWQARGESGTRAVVIYNRNLTDSKVVAEHYAQKRGVPAWQLLGFDLPTAETITRAEFREKLQEPLLAKLEE